MRASALKRSTAQTLGRQMLICVEAPGVSHEDLGRESREPADAPRLRPSAQQQRFFVGGCLVHVCPSNVAG